MSPSLARKCFSEALGTCLLVATVVGSGIAASRFSPTDHGLQLLENALATGAVLVALILALGPVSAAFNPVITLLARLDRTSTALLVLAQIVGGCLGSVVANLMFGLSAINLSHHHRSSGALWLSEIVATFGLVLIVLALERSDRLASAPYAVGGYITAAYFFTSSTSFANPAVTIGRSLSNSFAGIAPGSVLMFVLMQVVGALLAYGASQILFPRKGLA